MQHVYNIFQHHVVLSPDPEHDTLNAAHTAKVRDIQYRYARHAARFQHLIYRTGAPKECYFTVFAGGRLLSPSRLTGMCKLPSSPLQHQNNNAQLIQDTSLVLLYQTMRTLDTGMVGTHSSLIRQEHKDSYYKVKRCGELWE